MALGNHYLNPVIEKSRVAGRAYSVWIPPTACTWVLGITQVATSFTASRTADGDYFISRIAATGAETDYIIIPLNHAPFMVTTAPDTTKGEVIRGVNPTAVTFVYGVGVVDATSITAELHETTFAQNSAVAVDSNAVTVSTAATLTASATLRRFAIYSFALDAAPTVTAANMQIAVVLANTGTFQFYGAFVSGTLLL